jgi:glycosyltransferase involved in cell wall biosynthesis
MKVSVLTPAYNVEKYISETIESILSQSFQDFEFIILDDCSTDNTFKISTEYAKKDNRIKVFKNDKNLGIAGNRNKLLTLASGEYLAWQDSDDISLSDRLQKQVKVLDENIDVGIVGGGLQLFNESGDLSKRLFSITDAELRKSIFRYSPVAQPSAMIRKGVFDKVGNYDLKMPPAEDLDMSFRIGMYYKFANVPDVVVKYREHDKSATFTKLKVIETNTIAMRLIYANTKAYKMSFLDEVYNLCQYISIFLIPTKLKIWLFNLIRNNK